MSHSKEKEILAVIHELREEQEQVCKACSRKEDESSIGVALIVAAINRLTAAVDRLTRTERA